MQRMHNVDEKTWNKQLEEEDAKIRARSLKLAEEHGVYLAGKRAGIVECLANITELRKSFAPNSLSRLEDIFDEKFNSVQTQIDELVKKLAAMRK